MIASLLVLVSLIGILRLAVGRPKIRHGGRHERETRSGALPRKALLLGAVGLGFAGFAEHALLILGLIMAFLVIAIASAVVLVRRRRRRSLGHKATGRYPL